MESKELGILSIGSIITGIDSVASVSAIRQPSLAPRKIISIRCSYEKLIIFNKSDARFALTMSGISPFNNL